MNEQLNSKLKHGHKYLVNIDAKLKRCLSIMQSTYTIAKNSMRKFKVHEQWDEAIWIMMVMLAFEIPQKFRGLQRFPLLLQLESALLLLVNFWSSYPDRVTGTLSECSSYPLCSMLDRKKNNVNKWSILDFTKEGSVIHIVICMCRADIDISHLLQQSSLYLLGGSLTEPKAHRLSESRSSVCPGDQLSLPPNF